MGSSELCRVVRCCDAMARMPRGASDVPTRRLRRAVSRGFGAVCPQVVAIGSPGTARPGTVAGVLRLGRRSFEDDHLLVMAIINRTRDSFYDQGATFEEDSALERVRAVVAQGADLVDVGGVKAGPGELVGAAEEVRRPVPLVARIRDEFPDLVISLDTWRAEVAREVCRAGADVLNDAWGGFDPELAEVAAEHDAALVCTHTNGAAPRTPPHRPSYDDVVAAAVEATRGPARRAGGVGGGRENGPVDPPP